jgi:hypothetical protein
LEGDGDAALIFWIIERQQVSRRVDEEEED